MNKHVGVLLSVSLKLSHAVSQFGALRAILIALFCGVAVYYIFPRAQSFTVVAATQSVSMSLMPGTQTVWDLQNAIVCLRLPEGETVQNETSSDQPGGQCDPEYYAEATYPQVSVLWTAGHQLKVSGFDDTRLLIEVQTGSSTAPTHIVDDVVTDNSLVLFDRTTMRTLGGLLAKGEVAIGDLAEAGAAHLTRGGTYQIRENLGFPSRKSVVATGDILPGDLVRLTDGTGASIYSTLLLTQSTHALADFDVILTSPERQSAIEITRIGGAQSSISTRWTDRIANDALPVALSIFLGLFGASLGIVRSLSTQNKKE